MQKGYKVRSEKGVGEASMLVVANYESLNEIVHYPLYVYDRIIKSKYDVGRWKIKHLKENDVFTKQ